MKCTTRATASNYYEGNLDSKIYTVWYRVIYSVQGIMQFAFFWSLLYKPDDDPVVGSKHIAA